MVVLLRITQCGAHPQPSPTHRGHQAALSDEGDGQEGKGLSAQGGNAEREGQSMSSELRPC